MRLDRIVAAAAGHYLGRALRRALLALLVAAFAIVAIYFFTAAGTIALEMQYGGLQARLIVAAVYGTLALIAVVVLWATGRTRATAAEPALSHPREIQLAMLVEAVMLGYALARRGDRAR